MSKPITVVLDLGAASTVSFQITEEMIRANESPAVRQAFDDGKRTGDLGQAMTFAAAAIIEDLLDPKRDRNKSISVASGDHISFVPLRSIRSVRLDDLDHDKGPAGFVADYGSMTED